MAGVVNLAVLALLYWGRRLKKVISLLRKKVYPPRRKSWLCL